MGKFSVTNAALAGFGLVRERALAVLIWAIVLFVGRVAAAIAMAVIAGPHMAALDAALAAVPMDAKKASLAYALVAPGYLAAAVIMLPYSALISAAVYRAYLRPTEDRLPHVALGRRELAVVGLSFLMGLLLAAAGVVGMAMVGTASALAARLDATAGDTVMLLGLIAVMVGLIYIAIRLSLAGPMTYDQGRIVLLRAWPLTRGALWPLLAAFALAESLMMTVTALLLVFAYGLGGAAMVASGGSLNQFAGLAQSLTSPEKVLQPLPLGYFAFQAVVLALTAATMEGVRVYAFRLLGQAAAPGGPSKLAWR